MAKSDDYLYKTTTPIGGFIFGFSICFLIDIIFICSIIEDTHHKLEQRIVLVTIFTTCLVYMLLNYKIIYLYTDYIKIIYPNRNRKEIKIPIRNVIKIATTLIDSQEAVRVYLTNKKFLIYCDYEAATDTVIKPFKDAGIPVYYYRKSK